MWGLRLKSHLCYTTRRQVEARGALLSAPPLQTQLLCSGKSPLYRHKTNFQRLQPDRAAPPAGHEPLKARALHLFHVLFPVGVNYKQSRDVIGLLTINRHDVLLWLQPKWAVKKGERPTVRVREGGDSRCGTVHETHVYFIFNHKTCYFRIANSN